MIQIHFNIALTFEIEPKKGNVENVNRMLQLRNQFPLIRLIFMRRDLQNVVWSIMKRKGSKNNLQVAEEIRADPKSCDLPEGKQDCKDMSNACPSFLVSEILSTQPLRRSCSPQT